jgi:glycosyltransferase involved in cell wall biosynthesis
LIILVQTNLEGHRAEYISHILNSKIASGMRFAIWVRDANLEALRSKYADTESIIAFEVGEVSSIKIQQLQAYEKIDRLIFLDGDAALKAMMRNLGSIRKIPTQGLLLRIAHPSLKAGPKASLSWLAKIGILMTISAVSNVRFSKLVFVHKRNLGVIGQVRDPLPTLRVANKNTSTKETRLYRVGVVGTLDPRKNIKIAVQATALLGDGYELRLSGEVTESYKEELNRLISEQSHIRLLDAILTEDQMTAEIADLECFLVLQSTNAPSGTLLRALSQGVPVVVAGSRILKRAKRHYPDMIILSRLNSKAVARGIEKTRNLSRHQNSIMPSPEDFTLDLLGEKL